MYDTSSLYPVVHDLTEAEYSPSPSPFCAGGSFGRMTCFSLNELMVPSEETRPLVPLDSPTTGSCESTNNSEDNSVEFHATEQPAERPIEQPAEKPSKEAADPVCAPPPPARFQDAYVLTRQIYRGRHSMVWETIHRQSGLRYATKIIDRRTLSPCEDAAVFWEASILEQLPSGEGTISCVDFFQEPHHFFLVSEYAQGGSLQVRLANLKYLPEIQVKDLARSLLEGLQSLHSQDICHRNLKPDNILLHLMEDRLDQEETTLIAGFGSAVHIPYFEGIRGKLTGMCGSSFYAAPEVQSRLPYDTQADMWSLGVVLFVTLSGSLPFVDRDRRGLLRKIRKAEYIFDPKNWSGVSKGARRFIRKLLRANPQERMTVEQALEDPWLALPEPCVAVDEPIELSLTETTTKTRKVSFDEISKPPTKKKRQHRFMSILRRAPLAVIEEDEESSSSKTTTSSDSTDPGFTGTIFEI